MGKIREIIKNFEINENKTYQNSWNATNTGFLTKARYFHDKNTHELEIEGNFLILIKSTYQKPTADTILRKKD